LLWEDARQVVGIFAIMGAVVILAVAASMAAASGVALAAWMPFAGLLVLPLQALAWLLRGLVFQFLALSALSAYQAQYRRFSDERWPRAERAAPITVGRDA
jgi:hypothetical protein